MHASLRAATRFASRRWLQDRHSARSNRSFLSLRHGHTPSTHLELQMAKAEIKTKEAKARAAMSGGKGKRKASI